jgi:hypothetical protein
MNGLIRFWFNHEYVSPNDWVNMAKILSSNIYALYLDCKRDKLFGIIFGIDVLWGYRPKSNKANYPEYQTERAKDTKANVYQFHNWPLAGIRHSISELLLHPVAEIMPLS